MFEFIKSLWPRSPFSWFGLILGALSVLALIQYGFDYGFGPTFKLLLTYYENLTHAVIGWWAEPIIKVWLADASNYFGINLELYPHWKHVFILMGVYFFRDVSNSYQAGDRANAFFYLICGLILSITAAVGAGTVPASENNVTSNFLIAIAPISSMLLFDLISTIWRAVWRDESYTQLTPPNSKKRWDYFRVPFFHIVGRYVVAFTILSFSLQIPEIYSLENAGLFMLGVLIVVLSFYWIVLGMMHASFNSDPDASWWDTFRQSGSTGLGLSMLGVFFSALLFLTLNAGLQLYGL